MAKRDRITLENATPQELDKALQSHLDAVKARHKGTRHKWKMRQQLSEPNLIRCLYCNTEFVQGRSDQKFCSTKCRVYFNRALKKL